MEGDPDAAAAERVQQRWSGLPALSADWESRLAERRDTALRAFGDADARYDHVERIRACAPERRDALLELELMLGIPSPPDLQPQRLAVQVKELRDRFKRTASGGAVSAAELLLNWCALPGDGRRPRSTALREDHSESRASALSGADRRPESR